MLENSQGGEKAILVHLELRDIQLNADLREFRELALSAGVVIIEVFQSSRSVPNAKFFVGSGKAIELEQFVQAESIEVVLFNHTLTPAQHRNLERALKCRVLDRNHLILDIFAQRARTFEGKLQVELAQLEYLSSRLVRRWTHLERQKGGIGLRGPGETQLELDKRLIHNRIQYISSRLEKVSNQREQSRQARVRAQIPTISLVGYTNAGKSTLFNSLTGAHVYVANKLFATLDPTLRMVMLAGYGKVVLSDTVGFVRHLPHHLIKAFKATLEETRNASLILHVIDANDEMWRAQYTQVEEVLEQIGALDVPRIEVFNKVDLLPEHDIGAESKKPGLNTRIWLSAEKQLGLNELSEAIAEYLNQDIIIGQLKLPITESKLHAKIYEIASQVNESIDSNADYWLMDVKILSARWHYLTHHEPKILDYFTPQFDERE